MQRSSAFPYSDRVLLGLWQKSTNILYLHELHCFSVCVALKKKTLSQQFHAAGAVTSTLTLLSVSCHSWPFIISLSNLLFCPCACKTAKREISPQFNFVRISSPRSHHYLCHITHATELHININAANAHQFISPLDLLLHILNRKPSDVVAVWLRCDQSWGEKLHGEKSETTCQWMCFSTRRPPSSSLLC